VPRFGAAEANLPLCWMPSASITSANWSSARAELELAIAKLESALSALGMYYSSCPKAETLRLPTATASLGGSPLRDPLKRAD